MTEAPEKIWTTGTTSSGSWNNVSVSNPRIKLPETEYIRADFHEALEAENKRLRAVVQLADDNLTNLQPKIPNLVHHDWVQVFDGYIDPVIGAARAALEDEE